MQRALQQAKRGDRHARAWLADRLVGRSRMEPDDESAALDLGDLATLNDCAKAQRRITNTASAGAITLSEGERLSQLVSATAARLLDTELETRLSELEALSRS